MNALRMIALLSLSAASWLMPAVQAGQAPERSSDKRMSFLENRYLDPEILKGNAVEVLIKNKVDEIVMSHGIESELFRSTVSVKVNKKKVKEQVSAQSDPKSKELNAAPLSPTFLEAIRLFKHESLVDKALDKSRGPADNSESEVYEVGAATVLVGLQDSIEKTIADSIESSIKTQVGSLVGSGNLAVKIDRFTPKTAPKRGFFDVLEKLQFLAVVALIAFTLFGLMLLAKLLPGVRAPWQFKLDQAQKKEAEAAKQKEEEERDQRGQKRNAPKNSSAGLDGEHAENIDDRIKTLQLRINALAGRNPETVRRQIEAWVTSGESEQKVALAIEALSATGNLPSKLKVTPETFKTLKNAKELIINMDKATTLETLDWVCWELLAGECFDEKTADSPLRFLDKLDDRSFGILLLGEKPEAQNVMLSSLETRRATKVLSKLKPKVRQMLLQQLSTSQSFPQDQIEGLVTHLKSKVEQISAQKISSWDESDESSGAFLTILESMDFETQFTIARTFLDLPEDRRTHYLNKYFNIAFLPLFSESFLQEVFTDRPVEWIHAVTSVYDGLRARVAAVLPPMQQRMLESSTGEVSKKLVIDSLKGLHTEVQAKIKDGTYSLERIFGENLSANRDQDDPVQAAA